MTKEEIKEFINLYYKDNGHTYDTVTEALKTSWDARWKDIEYSEFKRDWPLLYSQIPRRIINA